MKHCLPLLPNDAAHATVERIAAIRTDGSDGSDGDITLPNHKE